jgi:hypothetical protein
MINEYGDKFYFSDKKMTRLHRENGPAMEYANGSKAWWINNNRHRLDGPAVECADGYKAWWVNGERLSEKEFNRRIAKDSTLSTSKKR